MKGTCGFMDSTYTSTMGCISTVCSYMMDGECMMKGTWSYVVHIHQRGMYMFGKKKPQHTSIKRNEKHHYQRNKCYFSDGARGRNGTKSFGWRFIGFSTAFGS